MRVLQKSLGVLFFILPVAAQTGNWGNIEALSAGTNVEIRLTGGESAQGRLESVSDSAVVVNQKNSQRMFARQGIAQLSVKKEGHRGRNAAIGLAVGAGGGLAAGAAVDSAAGPCKYACVLGSDAGK